MKYFCEDLEINKISKFTGISRQSLSKIFKEIRIIIANEYEKIFKLRGKIEVDKSYLAAKLVRGNRGAGL